MTKRTVVQFHYDGDVWQVIDYWAKNNGYRLKDSTGNERIYQKGVGFWVAPMMLRAVKNGQEITLEAWIHGTLFVRLMLLFMLPSEMGIESGGFRAAAPRSIARKAVNKLMQQLSLPPIS